MIAYLLDLFRSPSGFYADPWGDARNRMLHGYLIGGGLVWLGLNPWLVILGYAAIWELPQYLIEDAEADDCIEDTANVACVALAAAHASADLLFIHALFLVAGFLKRRAERAFRQGGAI